MLSVTHQGRVQTDAMGETVLKGQHKCKNVSEYFVNHERTEKWVCSEDWKEN